MGDGFEGVCHAQSPTGWAPTKNQGGGNSSLFAALALAQRYLHVGPCHGLVDEEGGAVVRHFPVGVGGSEGVACAVGGGQGCA